MEQDKIIKLTLATQIAGQVIAKMNGSPDVSNKEIATFVVDLTKEVVDQLYDKIN